MPHCHTCTNTPALHRGIEGFLNCACACGECRAQVDDDLRARIDRAVQSALNLASAEIKKAEQRLEGEIKRRLPKDEGPPPSGGNVNIKGSRSG